MAQVCKGVCTRLKPTHFKDSIRFRYQLGQKYCSECALFFYTKEVTCICCKTRLRSKAKSKKYGL